MALPIGERYLPVLLLVCVLQRTVSQIICRIEIDSGRGLWRETTPRLSANDATFCIGYSYRETTLTCVSPHCKRQGIVNGDCTLYYNTNGQDICLATCKPACNQHGYACSAGPGICPCQQHNERYNRAKMCVPYNNLIGCNTKQVNERNKCVPRNCIDTCTNGRCEEGGNCFCLDGFTHVSKTNICVPTECLEACVGGTCDVFGECVCLDGFMRNQRDRYKCDRIKCPGLESTNYCQNQCQKNGCKEANMHCTNYGCKCNDGFKEDPHDKYRCDRIQCPGWESTSYCQLQCQTNGCPDENTECVKEGCKCKNGFKKYSQARCEPIRCPDENEKAHCKKVCDERCNTECSDQGVCRCRVGYKLDQDNPYSCKIINCPSSHPDDNIYCKNICQGYCKNGTCDEKGHCECTAGFKKAQNTHYQCDKINCPSPDQDDKSYCVDQCKHFCQNGECDNEGTCTCKFGFKKDPSSLYQCNQTQCPSTEKEDYVYCQGQCNERCKDGACDDKGVCTCNKGFKKQLGHFDCVEITCPTSANEDKTYCRVKQCNITCNNGECDEEGACKCSEDFVSTNRTKVDCHHKCNLDGTCPLAAILSGIVGVGLAICVVIIVTAAILIRARNRREQAEKEQAEKEQDVQELPLETLYEEPKYANYGQGGDTEESTSHQPPDKPPRRPQRAK